MLAAMHERHGTTLRVGVGVEGLEGDDRGRARVRLADGTTDRRRAGRRRDRGRARTPSGSTGSGLTLGDGVECDETLCTGADGVYAAGDIASWLNPTFDTRMRLEHWTIAAEQGGARRTQRG